MVEIKSQHLEPLRQKESTKTCQEYTNCAGLTAPCKSIQPNRKPDSIKGPVSSTYQKNQSEITYYKGMLKFFTNDLQIL